MLLKRNQHQPVAFFPDHAARLSDFIHRLGLTEFLSTFHTGWCAGTFAFVRLPDGNGLHLWADSCSLSIKMQAFDPQGSRFHGVHFFDLKKSDEQKIRREIEKILKNPLPDRPKRPGKKP